MYLPFYASWWEWGGGMCFGPRFFQSFIPFTFLPSGIGFLWLLEKGRVQPWAKAAAVVLCLAVVATLPMQIAGVCVRDEQAAAVAIATGRSEPWCHIRLMELKLVRGIRHPEVYHKSDFTKLRPGEPDTVLDYHAKSTYQYLSDWWGVYLANKLRHTSSSVRLE